MIGTVTFTLVRRLQMAQPEFDYGAENFKGFYSLLKNIEFKTQR